MSQRDKAEKAIRGVGARLAFAKHLVRTEPCARSYAYRRKVKRDGAAARRRLDKALVSEEDSP